MLSKKDLPARGICAKFITPALERSGWDIQLLVPEESQEFAQVLASASVWDKSSYLSQEGVAESVNNLKVKNTHGLPPEQCEVIK